jgi:hypothetical protein
MFYVEEILVVDLVDDGLGLRQEGLPGEFESLVVAVGGFKEFLPGQMWFTEAQEEIVKDI